MSSPSLPASHVLQMSRSPSWFTTPFEVEVIKDNAATSNVTYHPPTGPPVSFSLAPLGVPGQLLCSAPSSFTATMADVAWASMRFHRLLNPAVGYRYWDTRSYLDGYVMLARAFGQAFALHSNPSWAVPSVGVEKSAYLHHGESLRSIQERFAYGLALLFSGGTLGIPIERFFFRRGGDARPDFVARVSAADLKKKTSFTGGVAASGEVVNLEVRGRSQGGSSFPSSVDSMYKLHQKAQATPNQAVWFVKTHMPNSRSPRTKARLVVIDPNEPVPLAPRDQLLIILHELMMISVRHGLMATASRLMEWIREVAEDLPPQVAVIEALVNSGALPPDSQDDYRQKSCDERFTGWIFSDLVLRLLGRGRRPGDLSRDELEEARWHLARQNPGPLWFSGVRRDVLDAVERKDAEFLLGLGVGRGPTGPRTEDDAGLDTDGGSSSQSVWAKRWTTFEDRSDDDVARDGVLRQLEAAVGQASR